MDTEVRLSRLTASSITSRPQAESARHTCSASMVSKTIVSIAVVGTPAVVASTAIVSRERDVVGTPGTIHTMAAYCRYAYYGYAYCGYAYYG